MLACFVRQLEPEDNEDVVNDERADAVEDVVDSDDVDFSNG